MNINAYLKFIVALLGAAGTALTGIWPTGAHWTATIVAAITAILVYLVPNTPPPGTP